MSHRPTALLVLGEIFIRPGGIERVNRMVCEALLEAPLGRGLQLIVLSRNDAASVELPKAWRDKGVQFKGCRGSRLRLAISTIILSWRHRPDVVYLGTANFSPVGFAARALGVCGHYVVQLHGPDDAWKRFRIHRRLATQRADVVLCTTPQTLQEAAIRNQIPLARLQLLELALARDWDDQQKVTEASPRLPAEPDTATILTVARLGTADSRKGVDQVLRALAELGGDRFHYRVVGDGPDRVRLESLAKELGIAESVDFVGRVDDKALHRSYRSADIFVMPSAQEGFGIVFIEAMSYGLPVIGGAHGGTPSLISNSENGYLVEQTDVAALATSLRTLIQDDELRRRIGHAGRETVDATYRYQSFLDRMTRMFRPFFPAP